MEKWEYPRSGHLNAVHHAGCVGEQEISCLTCAGIMQKHELKLIQGLHSILRRGFGEQFNMNPVIFLQSIFWA